jgi:hypothetical protein
VINEIRQKMTHLNFSAQSTKKEWMEFESPLSRFQISPSASEISESNDLVYNFCENSIDSPPLITQTTEPAHSHSTADQDFSIFQPTAIHPAVAVTTEYRETKPEHIHPNSAARSGIPCRHFPPSSLPLPPLAPVVLVPSLPLPPQLPYPPALISRRESDADRLARSPPPPPAGSDSRRPASPPHEDTHHMDWLQW